MRHPAQSSTARSSSTADELKTKVDPEMARDLIHRERAYLEKEQAAADRLVELAREHPEWFKKGEAEQILEGANTAELAAKALHAEAMLGTEQLGPNLYRADPRSVDSIRAIQKADGGQVIGVATDPVTGLRAIRIQPVTGEPFVVKEKLLAKRAPGPVSTAEAVHFEAWLEGPQAFAAEQGEVGDLYRARLREYYARDPRAAIDLAGRHGYEPEHPTSNAAAKNASEAAYSHYRFERGMDEASHPGDEPMTRADFDTLYRQGLEFDAVTDTWVRQRGAVPATHAGGIPAGAFRGRGPLANDRGGGDEGADRRQCGCVADGGRRATAGLRSARQRVGARAAQGRPRRARARRRRRGGLVPAAARPHAARTHPSVSRSGYRRRAVADRRGYRLRQAIFDRREGAVHQRRCLAPGPGVLPAEHVGPRACHGERDPAHRLYAVHPSRRRSHRQALLAKALDAIDIRRLDAQLGRAAGELLSRAKQNDVIDAALVLLANDGDRVISSDPDDLAPLARAADIDIELVIP